MAITERKIEGGWQWLSGEVTVAAAAWTELMRIPLHRGDGVLNIEIVSALASNAALDGFRVKLKDHGTGVEYEFLGSSDWSSTTIASLLFTDSVVPQTLAAGATSHVHIKTSGAVQAIIAASGDGNTALITCRVSMRERS